MWNRFVCLERPIGLVGWRARIGLFAIALAFSVSACARGTRAQDLDPPLDIATFNETFSDTFRELSIGNSPGSGKRWFTHTPWSGDFGDATFMNNGPEGPFTAGPAGLQIKASKAGDGKWTSGLISSRDRDGALGQGFTQKFGYFEMMAKLPDGHGTWPAFWLIGVDKAKAAVEIDIMEAYGKFPDAYNSTVHLYSGGKDNSQVFKNSVDKGILSRQFNTFGVLIGDKKTIFYFNRKPVVSMDTPAAYKQPFYILADLALGGGWPITGLSSPQVMQIRYIKAFESKTDPG